MKEYIEREAALDGLDGIDWYHINDNGRLVSGGTSGMDTYVPFKAVEEMLRSIPAADVVDGEAYRELLKVARKMHCWIFLNTADELEAYDECGLTDEMNALLGYGGQFTANMDGGVNDERIQRTRSGAFRNMENLSRA